MADAMTPRARAKRVQELIHRAAEPMFPNPSDVKAALGELSVLLGEWGELLETMPKITFMGSNDGKI